MIKMMDLRNGNFKNLKDVEYVLKYLPNTTDSELIEANNDINKYEDLKHKAEDQEVFDMLY